MADDLFDSKIVDHQSELGSHSVETMFRCSYHQQHHHLMFRTEVDIELGVFDLALSVYLTPNSVKAVSRDTHGGHGSHQLTSSAQDFGLDHVQKLFLLGGGQLIRQARKE